jgi:hypothetical protein
MDSITVNCHVLLLHVAKTNQISFPEIDIHIRPASGPNSTNRCPRTRDPLSGMPEGEA